MDPRLRAAVDARTLRRLDAHFAGFVAGLAGGAADDALLAAAALASQQLGEGHICVDLARHAGRTLFADAAAEGTGIAAPGLAAWRDALQASPAVQPPGGLAPLVLDGDRLYLRRYWCFEQDLARGLVALAGHDHPVDDALLRDGLERLFPRPDDGVDWQRVAAAVAVRRGVTVISGGPGTGKTRTVSRVLALLAEQGLAGGSAPRIRLAAPTGKAAARLTESITASLPGDAALQSPTVLEAIPREAVTLHRLLRARPGRARFGHDADNPLHLDVLLVDEASMVDLPLMARLVDALPPGARLVLLGDRDQLASVEAGAVLGDLCSGAEGYSPGMRDWLAAVTGEALPAGTATASPLADGVAFLYRSWRFRDTADGPPGIGTLARAVRDGEGETAAALLTAADDIGDGELAHRHVDAATLPAALAETAVPFFRGIAGEATPADALSALGALRVLCALRDGPFGVNAVNHAIREALGPTALERWYHGQPVMVTSNDYALGLANGDVGVVWRTPEGLRAHFPDPAGGVRDFAPQRLPAHECVYAMTVHKSQGSEFERVLMILPDEPTPVLTRELIYTGLTRARRHATVWGDPAVLQEAVSHRPTRRASGLAAALRAHAPDAAGPGGA
ncbi:exodeoxyribonuclease V subunit alpha [Arhodomonas aquaeolei]|uniref:exodeoxyribonuclease V subunit alpha n=1 Tax=Arhodomonas aquaeolei TaxID=2369 RepID=UPI00037F639C|nr:exodeoxyribonuclease V subunit alpha [Arhodomonas aquaeolei]